MTNIGSVLSSLIGGRMFDTVGVRPTMLTAVAICAVGAAIAIAATFIRRSGTERQSLR
jgi:MFS family permease